MSFVLYSKWIVIKTFLYTVMGVRRIFSTGGHCFFFQKFSGGAKVVKFVFSHQKLKNNLFC